MPRPGAHRAQDRQLAAALIKSCRDDRHQPGQADPRNQQAHQQQPALADAHHVPQHVERHAGQDGHQRLGLKFKDRALHRKHRRAGLQADQHCGDLFGCQVVAAHRIGRDSHARQRSARDPVEMDRLHAVQPDVHRPVHRRAGAREDAARCPPCLSAPRPPATAACSCRSRSGRAGTRSHPPAGQSARSPGSPRSPWASGSAGLQC